MAVVDPIKITGLAEFNRDLRRIDANLPKGLRLAANEAANVIVSWARPRVERRSGAAQASVRAASTRTEGRVFGGGSRAPHYGWLDFGGRVGRRRSVKRPFLKGGRYIYAGYQANRDEVRRVQIEALIRLVEESGVALDG